MEVSIYDTVESSLENHTGNTRYIIVAKSVSAHCCFEFTVIDTHAGYNGQCWNKTMCETFEKQDAIDVCHALNQSACS